MKCTTILPVFAALVGLAQAHSTVFSIWVNGVDQGDGKGRYIRSPPNNSPVKDVESQDIICNVNGLRAVPESVKVKGGDTIDVEWHHNTRNDDIIDLSHKGPIVTYIAEASTNGVGAVWTKLSEEGFSNGKWAVENLVANGGKHSVTLPANIAPGDYLLRAEIIAHHESDTDFKVNPARGAQFYPSCSQITVTSGGNARPSQNFNFIGGYKSDGVGILFNLYSEDPNTYVIPGPRVAAFGGSSPAQPAPVPTSTRAATTLITSVRPAPTTSAVATSAVPRPTTTIPAPAPVPTTTSVRAPVQPAPTGGNTLAVKQYYQCGGINFTGNTNCEAGLICKEWNPYYAQCVNPKDIQ